MNTEKINAYRQVMEVLKEVNSLRTYDNQGTPERADLDAMAISLEALSWEIINKDITKILDSLTHKITDLASLNKKIKDSYAHLKKVSERISKLAEVIGVLIEITSKAISAGLL